MRLLRQRHTPSCEISQNPWGQQLALGLTLYNTRVYSSYNTCTYSGYQIGLSIIAVKCTTTIGLLAKRNCTHSHLRLTQNVKSLTAVRLCNL